MCSSTGVLYVLNAARGDTVSKLQLPGQVFSSPVCLGNKLVVGCRDDLVYCVEISLKQ